MNLMPFIDFVVPQALDAMLKHSGEKLLLTSLLRLIKYCILMADKEIIKHFELIVSGAIKLFEGNPSNNQRMLSLIPTILLTLNNSEQIETWLIQNYGSLSEFSITTLRNFDKEPDIIKEIISIVSKVLSSYPKVILQNPSLHELDLLIIDSIDKTREFEASRDAINFNVQLLSVGQPDQIIPLVPHLINTIVRLLPILHRTLLHFVRNITMAYHANSFFRLQSSFQF
jgi:hypothetical protein